MFPYLHPLVREYHYHSIVAQVFHVQGQITFNPLAARVGHLMHRCDFHLKYGCEAQMIRSGSTTLTVAFRHQGG